MIQTIYDIIKAHGSAPITIGIKADTKESIYLPDSNRYEQAGTAFNIILPNKP